MKYFILFLSIATLAGCSKDDDPKSTADKLVGYYELTSLTSNTPLDLNNDGEQSTDMYFEIASPHNTIDGQSISFFDFSAPPNLLEMTNTRLIAVNFPDQEIGLTVDQEPYLIEYRRAFISYSYRTNDDSNFITLVNENPDFIEKGELVAMELLPNGDLELILSKDAFDFVASTWNRVSMTAIYEKVN